MADPPSPRVPLVEGPMNLFFEPLRGLRVFEVICYQGVHRYLDAVESSDLLPEEKVHSFSGA